MQEELVYQYKKRKLFIVYLLINFLISVAIMAFFYFLVNIHNHTVLLVILGIIVLSDAVMSVRKIQELRKMSPYITVNKNGIDSEQYVGKHIDWKDIKGFEITWIKTYRSIGVLTDSHNPNTYEIDGKRYFLIPCVDSKEKPARIIEDLEMYRLMMEKRKVRLKK